MKYVIVPVCVIAMSFLFAGSAYSESDVIPNWIKGVAAFWAEDRITDSEFVVALEFMIEAGLIQVNDPIVQELEKENGKLRQQIESLEPGNTSQPETTQIVFDSVTVSIPPGTGIPGCEKTDECYLPYEITVESGATVSWINDDSAAHTVTSGNANAGPTSVFDSSLFMAGDVFEFTFNDAGTYDYYCSVHPWMTGFVYVTESKAMVESEPTENTQESEPTENTQESEPTENTQESEPTENTQESEQRNQMPSSHISTNDDSYTLGDSVEITAKIMFEPTYGLDGNEIVASETVFIQQVVFDDPWNHKPVIVCNKLLEDDHYGHVAGDWTYPLDGTYHKCINDDNIIEFSYKVLNHHKAGTYYFRLGHIDHHGEFVNRAESQPFTIN